MIFRLIIYGLLGWNLEILWTGLGSLIRGDMNMMGHTSVWMFVIYGVSGIGFEFVHNKIRDKRWYERGLIWMYLIFAAELVSGAALAIFDIHPWEYNGTFALFGLIRLDYAPVWFIVGLLFEQVHSFVTGLQVARRG